MSAPTPDLPDLPDLPPVRAPELPTELDWVDADGGARRIVDLRGKAVLLDFWTYG